MTHQFLQVIVDSLTGNAAVKALVGLNIYEGHISEFYDADAKNKTTVKFPCITLVVTNPQPIGGKLKACSTATVEIKAHALTQKQANQIYDAAKEVLYSKRLYNDNFNIITGELPDLPETMTDPDSLPQITYNSYTYFDCYAQRKT